jgi:hypothetical protein
MSKLEIDYFTFGSPYRIFQKEIPNLAKTLHEANVLFVTNTLNEMIYNQLKNSMSAKDQRDISSYIIHIIKPFIRDSGITREQFGECWGLMEKEYKTMYHECLGKMFK